MPGRLTTHVLDTARGCPAAGLRLELWRGDDCLADVTTNADGRTDAPLLTGAAFAPGAYRLVFHVGDYFRGLPGVAEPPFLDAVPIASARRRRRALPRAAARLAVGVHHLPGQLTCATA